METNEVSSWSVNDNRKYNVQQPVGFKQLELNEASSVQLNAVWMLA